MCFVAPGLLSCCLYPQSFTPKLSLSSLWLGWSGNITSAGTGKLKGKEFKSRFWGPAAEWLGFYRFSPKMGFLCQIPNTGEIGISCGWISLFSAEFTLLGWNSPQPMSEVLSRGITGLHNCFRSWITTKCCPRSGVPFAVWAHHSPYSAWIAFQHALRSHFALPSAFSFPLEHLYWY